MKKSLTAVSFLLAVLMMITMLSACADNSIPAQTAEITQAAPSAPVATEQGPQLFEYCLLRSPFGRHLPGTSPN